MVMLQVTLQDHQADLRLSCFCTSNQHDYRNDKQVTTRWPYFFSKSNQLHNRSCVHRSVNMKSQQANDTAQNSMGKNHLTLRTSMHTLTSQNTVTLFRNDNQVFLSIDILFSTSSVLNTKY